jgi:hypothetical protein
LRILGLQEGDVLVAVEGQPVGALAESLEVTEPTLTVLRRVPGERPVLAPEILGRQVLQEFMELPEAQRTPMRFARMVANQQTLVSGGFGVILVPAAKNPDDAEWLRVANPMPKESEAALREVVEAIQRRAKLPAIETTEAEAARNLLTEGHFVEAQERAMRALFEAAAVPEGRREERVFRDLQALYLQAVRQRERERRVLLSPGPRFGIVVETLLSGTRKPLNQDIFLDVDGSNDFMLAVGWNTSLHAPTPDGGLPFFRDLDLLLEYAFTQRRFEGPRGADEIPPGAEAPTDVRMKTQEHRFSFELTYQPRVLSRLRPVLRGGPALFLVKARAFDENGIERQQVDVDTWGWVLGLGIDLYRQRGGGFRTGIVGSYQVVTHTFCESEAPAWIDASNIPEYKHEQLQISRPYPSQCGNQPGFELDLSAWQVGLLMAYEF